ncbi:MAG: hypothetical protein HT580_14880 [Dechloromonas sp.]|nr:MAG: hypothetical protein HT580_14880 [Dechloromonas sp.]
MTVTAGVKNHGGPPFEQAAAGVIDGELVEDVVPVAGKALGGYAQFARQIVEAGNMQLHAAHAGQVALTRRFAGRGQQRAMHGHRLRRVFDAGGGAQPAFSAQRIGRVGMADGAAGNGRWRPVEHGIEQAHAALMRDAGGDAGAV